MRVNCEQLSQEWFSWRKGKVSSSMLGAIMNVSPWKTRNALWKEVLGIKPPQEQNHHMERGLRMEGTVREMVERELMCTFEPACFESEENPLFIASLDGISPDGQSIIEIKVPLKHKDEIPEHYRMQMNWAMWISGATQCFYCVWAEERLDIKVVFMDEVLVKAMSKEALLFLDQLKNLEEPEAGDSDCTELLDPYSVKLSAEYDILDLEIKNLEAQRETIRSQLTEKAKEGNVRIGNLIVSKVRMPGTVQYKNIPELKSIDLELYRSAPKDIYRITRKKI
jgi:putative phage-type endonuclease